MNEVLIAPSILASDFSRLGEEVERVAAAGANWIHLDVMDGHFVPNITFGPEVVKAIRPRTDRLFDCHLMIAPADPYLAAFAEAGADLITVHAEAGPHLDRSLQAIRAFGKRVGVSICPATPESAIEHVLDRLDLILVMTVNPGFGGQTFIPAMVEKIRRLRAMIAGRPIRLEVDGGITAETAPLAVAAGASVLAAGGMLLTGWYWLDPLAAIVVSLVIAWSTWRLLKSALALSLDAVPAGIDWAAVEARLMAFPGVSSVHDLHIWSLSTTRAALTAHLVMPGGCPGDAFYEAAAEALEHDFGIDHTTLQVECGDGDSCRLAPADRILVGAEHHARGTAGGGRSRVVRRTRSPTSRRRRVLYQPHQELTGLGQQGVPGGAAGIEDVVVARPQAVGEEALAQVQPHPLDRVQLG